jgi:hypothetical protein
MSSDRQEALIEAPVEEVWELVGDPRRYPEWAGNVLEVTGLATVEQGATYRQTNKLPLGKRTTTFEVEALEELKEIRLRCTQSGFYSRWLLTEARDETFADVEIGMEPIELSARAVDATMGKRWYRRIAGSQLDGVRKIVRRERAG